MKLTYVLTENDGSNHPSKDATYLILLEDIHNGDELIYPGLWNQESMEFVFFNTDFIFPHLRPTFQRTASAHYIKAWCLLN